MPPKTLDWSWDSRLTITAKMFFVSYTAIHSLTQPYTAIHSHKQSRLIYAGHIITQLVISCVQRQIFCQSYRNPSYCTFDINKLNHVTCKTFCASLKNPSSKKCSSNNYTKYDSWICYIDMTVQMLV